MKCNACGTDNENTARYCANCGNALSLTCPCCGVNIASTDYFCPDCGTITQQTPKAKTTKIISEPSKSIAPIKAPYTTENKKMDKKKIIKIIIFAVMFGFPVIGTIIMSIIINAMSVGFDLFFGI